MPLFAPRPCWRSSTSAPMPRKPSRFSLKRRTTMTHWFASTPARPSRESKGFIRLLVTAKTRLDQVGDRGLLAQTPDVAISHCCNYSVTVLQESLGCLANLNVIHVNKPLEMFVLRLCSPTFCDSWRS